MPAAVVDELLLLQLLGGQGNAGAPDTQHHAEELLGQDEPVGLDAVMGHQEPPAASLLDGVKAVAGRRLGDLVEQGVDVMQHHGSHGGAVRERVTKQVGRHAQGGAGHLDIDVARCDRVAQNDRQADHSFIADGPDLGGGAVQHGVHQGGDARHWKIDEPDRLAGPGQLEFVVERHRFEMRAKALEIVCGKQLEQSVSSRLKWLIHETMVLGAPARNSACKAQASRMKRSRSLLFLLEPG